MKRTFKINGIEITFAQIRFMENNKETAAIIAGTKQDATCDKGIILEELLPETAEQAEIMYSKAKTVNNQITLDDKKHIFWILAKAKYINESDKNHLYRCEFDGEPENICTYADSKAEAIARFSKFFESDIIFFKAAICDEMNSKNLKII